VLTGEEFAKVISPPLLPISVRTPPGLVKAMTAPLDALQGTELR
jgi:hypothetical protein